MSPLILLFVICRCCFLSILHQLTIESWRSWELEELEKRHWLILTWITIDYVHSVQMFSLFCILQSAFVILIAPSDSAKYTQIIDPNSQRIYCYIGPIHLYISPRYGASRFVMQNNFILVVDNNMAAG